MTDEADSLHERHLEQRSSGQSRDARRRRSRLAQRDTIQMPLGESVNEQGNIEYEIVTLERVDDPDGDGFPQDYEEVERETHTYEPVTSPFDETAYPDDTGSLDFDKLFNNDSGPYVPEFEWTINESTGVIVFDTVDEIPDGYFDVPGPVQFPLYIRPDLSNVIRRELKDGKSLEEAVGAVSEYDTLLPTQPDVELTQSKDVSNEDALRLYTYWRQTDNASHTVTDRADRPSFRDKLSINASLSRNTLAYTISDNIDEIGPLDLDTQTREVIREFRDTDLSSQLRELPEPETDGMSPPQDTLLTRDVKKIGYSCIQLGRTGDWTKYDKWELFKPHELAAKDNIHANDAHKNLDVISRYWNQDSPQAQTLWTHLREERRLSLRQMFHATFDQFVANAQERGHLPESVEVAIDITGWAYFSIDNDPPGTEQTKPSRNYGKSWQFATISLVNVDLPFVIGFRELHFRKHKHYAVQQLLNFVETRFDIEQVYLDSAFYSEAVRDALDSNNRNFLMKAPRRMKLFKNLVDGVNWRDETINHAPYQIKTPKHQEYEDWLIARYSKKRSDLRDKTTSSVGGLPKPYRDWEAFYGNIDPDDYPGGAKQLTNDYRLRWGIETSYRVMKNYFLPKSNTNLWRKRVFQFGLAVLYYNMWLAANSRKAVENGESVKDGQGRYQMTAHRFMMSLLHDFESVRIGEVSDLSDVSDLVKENL
ncbi:transposase [Halovenus aranensis]|nr:transposase [Halovenus aranensis]